MALKKFSFLNFNKKIIFLYVNDLSKNWWNKNALEKNNKFRNIFYFVAQRQPVKKVFRKKRYAGGGVFLWILRSF